MARPKQFDCAEAISTILAEDDGMWLPRVRSFFDFIGFIAYPQFPTRAASISNIYRLTYLSNYLDANEDLSLNKDEYKLLLRECKNLISEIPSRYNVHLDPFYVYEYQDGAAEIVRFILSYKAETTKVTDQASIGKACYVLHQGGYGPRSQAKEAIFAGIWADNKSVAAFRYVNMRQSRMLTFQVNKKNFQTRVSTLLADRSRLRRFFAQSLWVQKRLRKILYKAAFRGTKLPTFPANLREEAMSIEQPSDLVKKIMESYSSVGRN
jgi:hypothetical protein